MNQILYKNELTRSSSVNKVIIVFFFVIELLLLSLLVFENYKIAIILTTVFFGIFGLYLIFNNPFLILPISLLSILAGTIGSGTSKLSFTDIFFPLAFLILTIKLFYDYNKSIHPRYYPIVGIYIIFLVWSFFTVLVAIDKSLAIAYWRNYFTGFIFFIFSLSFVKTYKQIRIFLLILVVWGVILAFIEFNILISLGGISSGLVKLFLSKNLLATSWGKSNYLATFYVLIIPITMGYLFTIKDKKWKVLLSTSLVLMFSAVIITLSKGGILSLGIGLILFISKVLKPRTFFPLLGLFALIAIILLLNPLTYILFTGISTVESNLSTYSRLNFYEDVWKTFLKNPLTGVGFANLGHYSKFKYTTDAASAHNIILGTLGETGVMGALTFLSTLGLSFVICFKNYYKEKIGSIKILTWSFICAFIGVLVHSMMEPNFEGFQFAVMFWSSLAVFLNLANLPNIEKKQFIDVDASAK